MTNILVAGAIAPSIPEEPRLSDHEWRMRAVTINTGRSLAVPPSRGISSAGTTDSTAQRHPDPGSPGSIGRNSGRNRFTPARSGDRPPSNRPAARPPSPACPASLSTAPRMRGSNAPKEDSVGVRSYCGGESVRTAVSTVVREIPSLNALRAFGTPSAASRRINAQSLKVITHNNRVFTFLRRN